MRKNVGWPGDRVFFVDEGGFEISEQYGGIVERVRSAFGRARCRSRDASKSVSRSSRGRMKRPKES